MLLTAAVQIQQPSPSERDTLDQKRSTESGGANTSESYHKYDAARQLSEEGPLIFHRALVAVSAIEATIGAGMILVGVLLIGLARGQWGFHDEAARRHARAAQERP